MLPSSLLFLTILLESPPVTLLERNHTGRYATFWIYAVVLFNSCHKNRRGLEKAVGFLPLLVQTKNNELLRYGVS